MSDRTKRIRNEARGLPTKELSRLVADLSSELGDREELELSPEWAAEIKRRLDDIDKGRVKLLSSEEFFASLEKTLRECTSSAVSSRGARGSKRRNEMVRRAKQPRST